MEWFNLDNSRPEIAEWVLCICTKQSYWLGFRANGGWYVNTNYGQKFIANSDTSKIIEIQYWTYLPNPTKAEKLVQSVSLQQEIERLKESNQKLIERKNEIFDIATKQKSHITKLEGMLEKSNAFIASMKIVFGENKALGKGAYMITGEVSEIYKAHQEYESGI